MISSPGSPEPLAPAPAYPAKRLMPLVPAVTASAELLAARLGCRQENLSRAFATLRDFGVETHGARVILHDIAKLKAYAEPDEAFA